MQKIEITLPKFLGREDRGSAESLAVEEPLEIRLASSGNSEKSQAVSITMRTPGHDAELAVGFLFGEGILKKRSDILEVLPCGPKKESNQASNTIKVILSPEVQPDLDRLQRNFYATSSCGVCGKASLDALEAEGLQSVTNDEVTLSQQLLQALPERLRANQHGFNSTGGLHATGLFTTDGELLLAREDVGRHNAMDKVIGQAFLNGDPHLSNRIMLVSGRASFELVQKALMAKIPFLAAVGAPSSLAYSMAKRYNMTLVGFLKPGRFNCYHGDWRIS